VQQKIAILLLKTLPNLKWFRIFACLPAG